MKHETFKWNTMNDDGEEIVIEFPAKRDICPRCEGRGQHVNPAIDGNGLSREDFAEDPDFEEAYFEGRYDIVCDECDGDKVILIVDSARAEQEMPDQYKAYIEYLDDEVEYRRECEAERRMGA